MKNYSFVSIIILFGILMITLPIFESKPQNFENISFFSPQESRGLVIVGQNSFLPLNNPLNPESQIRTVKVVVTAYSSSPWETQGNPFVTASGNWVREGIIANNMLPFGTKVRMPDLFGQQVFVVEDRMHQRKGYYHIDVWFPSYREALNFGAKTTYIEVLEN